MHLVASSFVYWAIINTIFYCARMCVHRLELNLFLNHHVYYLWVCPKQMLTRFVVNQYQHSLLFFMTVSKKTIITSNFLCSICIVKNLIVIVYISQMYSVINFPIKIVQFLDTYMYMHTPFVFVNCIYSYKVLRQMTPKTRLQL